MLKKIAIARVFKSRLIVRGIFGGQRNLPGKDYLRVIREKSEANGFVLQSPYKSITTPNLTIDQYVWKNIASWSELTALECAETGKKFSFSRLRDHCAALAIRLRKKYGLSKGDIVGICMANHPGKNNMWNEMRAFLLEAEYCDLPN